MAGRAPVNAITRLMTNEANRPTDGSTPATKENAITSGISAKVATAPASSSRGMLGAHSARRRVSKGEVMEPQRARRRVERETKNQSNRAYNAHPASALSY